LPLAILGRIIGGLLCGNLGVVKSFLTEITDDTNRSSAFYLFSLSWAVGSVLAPLLGGLLCKPAVKYPTAFSDDADSIWVVFPYLLPCLVVFCVSVISASLCMCFMIESRGASKEEIQARINGTALQRKDSSDRLLTGSPHSDDDGIELGSVNSPSLHNPMGNVSNSVDSPAYARLPMDSATDIDQDSANDDVAYTPTTNTLHLQPPAAENDDFQDRRGQRSPMMSLSPVPEGRVVDVDTLPVPTMSAASAGVSTSVPHGGVRHRSRSSSNSTYLDLEQPPARHSSGTGALIMDAPSGSHGGIAMLKRGHNSDEEGSSRAGTEADSVTAGEGWEDGDDREEEMCCPGLVEYLSCGSLSRSGAGAMAGMDVTVHSSEQLLGGSERSSTSSNSSGGDRRVGAGGAHSKAGKGSTSRVLLQRVVVLSTLNYGMICASSILMDETVPLFLKQDNASGGFGFSSTQIGAVLSSGAAGMMFLTVVCLPLTEGVSNKWLSFMSLGVSIPLELVYPLIAILNNEVLSGVNKTEHMWLLFPMLMFFTAVRNYFTCLAFTSSIMMVNHSVYDEYLGAVNGLGQSLGALARSAGPAVGGLLWSLGTKYHFVYLNFIAVTLLYLLNMYVSDLVPQSLDYKKKRRGATGAVEEGSAGAAAGHM
jgi:hypothetical protein